MSRLTLSFSLAAALLTPVALAQTAPTEAGAAPPAPVEAGADAAAPVTSSDAEAAPVGAPAPEDAPPARPKEPVVFESDGQVRLLGQAPPALLPVDAQGGVMGQSGLLDLRVRLAVRAKWKILEIGTEWDVVDTQIAGDTWDIDTSEDRRRRDARIDTRGPGTHPRRLALSVWSPIGVGIEGGLVTSNWGLGLLANHGAREQLFGRVDRADRMLRLRTTFAPLRREGQLLPLFVSFAVDQVVEDDLAQLGQERAYQVIGSVLWNEPEGRKFGAYLVYRSQNEQDTMLRPTQALVADVYADVPWTFGGSGWTGRAAVEAAGIFGTTQAVLPYQGDASAVSNGGAALELEAHSPGDVVITHLRAGVSSATGDPDGGGLHDFNFDANYNVGMVLFDEVMGAIDAATYAQLRDTGNIGQAPYGAELMVTEGAVRRAGYLQPVVVTHPHPLLDVRLGAVMAWSTGPIAQPFYTSRAGGVPHNQLNQPTDGRRWLGAEIDWAFAIGRDGRGTSSLPVHPSLVIEGGHAILGEGLGGGTASNIMLTGRVDW